MELEYPKREERIPIVRPNNDESIGQKIFAIRCSLNEVIGVVNDMKELLDSLVDAHKDEIQ